MAGTLMQVCEGKWGICSKDVLALEGVASSENVQEGALTQSPATMDDAVAPSSSAPSNDILVEGSVEQPLNGNGESNEEAKPSENAAGGSREAGRSKCQAAGIQVYEVEERCCYGYVCHMVVYIV